MDPLKLFLLLDALYAKVVSIIFGSHIAMVNLRRKKGVNIMSNIQEGLKKKKYLEAEVTHPLNPSLLVQVTPQP